MKRVHAVVHRSAHQLFKALIVFVRNGSKVPAVRVKDKRTRKRAPFSLIISRKTLFANIARHHTRVARQHRLHTQFALTFQNVLRQCSLSFIPPFRVRSAPTLKVVHAPPGLKARTSHKLVRLGRRVAQILGQQVIPHHVQAHNLQRHVDAMQGHPVNFLLPAFPRPGRHGVRKSAIVQIVAIVSIAHMLFLAGRHRQRSLAQILRQVVPRQVHPRRMVQIPVDTRCHSQCRATLDTRFSSLCSNHKHLLTILRQRFVDHRDKAFSRALSANAVQQVLNSSRICVGSPCWQHRQTNQHEPGTQPN